MRPMYAKTLHVEGMDLAGKSTATAAFLASHPEAEHHRNALVDNNPIYTVADELRRLDKAAADVLGDLYVAALKYDVSDGSRPDVLAVQDSTILLRSMAFNDVIGATDVVGRLARLVAQHPRYGLTVVLIASIESRQARLIERQQSAPEEVAPDDLQILTAPDRFLAMERRLVTLARLYFNATVIDTTTMTKLEVADTVFGLWQARVCGEADDQPMAA